MERAGLMADGEVIHGHHLPPTLQTAEASGTVVSASIGGAVATFERSLIGDALKTTRGNRAKAARLLVTTERVITYKVKKYGIDRPLPATRLRREAASVRPVASWKTTPPLPRRAGWPPAPVPRR